MATKLTGGQLLFRRSEGGSGGKSAEKQIRLTAKGELEGKKQLPGVGSTPSRGGRSGSLKNVD